MGWTIVQICSPLHKAIRLSLLESIEIGEIGFGSAASDWGGCFADVDITFKCLEQVLSSFLSSFTYSECKDDTDISEVGQA